MWPLYTPSLGTLAQDAAARLPLNMGDKIKRFSDLCFRIAKAV
ncbi:MAG: hypothetical protein WAM98_20135 [Terriglobales bacterium]